MAVCPDLIGVGVGFLVGPLVDVGLEVAVGEIAVLIFPLPPAA